ncbi:hypothetical protein IAR50_006420 [Cryptococcus sp. DSM 104548]
MRPSSSSAMAALCQTMLAQGPRARPVFCLARRSIQSTARVWRDPIPIPTTTPTPSLTSEPPLSLPRSLSPTRALLLLAVPFPPSTWPSHLEMASPLLATASAHLKSRGIGVNVVYDQSLPVPEGSMLGMGEEKYQARLYWPDGRKRVWGKFSMATLSSADLEKELAYTPSIAAEGWPLLATSAKRRPKEILVCTHGSRDCRCHDQGVPLVDALREEVKKKGLENEVKIGEVAHVGGHKYAANAILLPTMDMLSNLTAKDAPQVLSQLLTLTAHALSPDKGDGASLWSHWRGRYGLTGEQQAKLWGVMDPDAEAVPDQRESVQLRFRTYEGEEKLVEGKVGENLLEVGKANELPSLEGVCGGNLECATCHLYISETPAAPVPEPSETELDMMGYAIGYKDGESRLGCQVKVTPALGQWCKDGGVIGLPRF